MLKYLRMDLYRLVKGKMLWVMLVVLLMMALGSAAMAWWQSTSDAAPTSVGISFGATDASSVPSPERASDGTIDGFERNQSSLWLTGGTMGLITSLAIALLFALDFSSGYVKNLPASRRERLCYYGEKLVLIVLLVVGMFLFAILAFELFRAVADLSYERVGTVGEVAVWFGLSVALLTAYGAVTALVTWLSRGKGAGIATAIVLSMGILEGFVGMGLTSLAEIWEPFERVVEWLPVSSFGLLKQGGEALLASPGDIGHVLVTSVVIIAVCATVALGVCSRRDV